jgi:peptidoglycan/LPS O-acetylase OafA/YrhL
MGLLRIYLALSVMFSHIGTVKWLPAVPADFAVNMFFVMSGFYISLGLNERYRTSADNREFYLGRALRLWPTYLFSLAILIPTGFLAATIHQILALPRLMMAIAIFSNLFIVGTDWLLHISAFDGAIHFSEFGIDKAHNGVSAILNLPAWTLSIEILFYLLAPFIVRSFRRSVAFFSVGVVYLFCVNHYSAYLPPLRTDLYFPGPTFYFGLGAVGYWVHRVFPASRVRNLWVFPVIFLMVVQALHLTPGAVALFAVAMLAKPAFEICRYSKVDQWFGDLSYPLYITHLPTTILVRSLGLFAATTDSYFLSIVFVTLVAVYMVEKPIDRFRSSRRRRKQLNRKVASPDSQPLPRDNAE